MLEDGSHERAVRDVRDNATSEKTGPHLTIADVAAACGLPQPVIAQLVSRTWTKDGWLYTEAQRDEAAEIAASWTRPDGKPSRTTPDHSRQRPGDLR